MEIGPILKQATAVKKAEGHPAAIKFLLDQYSKIQNDDLGQLLGKIFTYFKKDSTNQKVKDFVNGLIQNKTIDQYSGYLNSYYWTLKDYEAFRLTIMKQISELNPNDVWSYTWYLARHQNSLCQYYEVKGLDKENNAIEYLFSMLFGAYIDVARELTNFDSNFFNFYFHLTSRDRELKFHRRIDYPGLSTSAEVLFKQHTVSKCLKTLNFTDELEPIIKIATQKIYVDFPKQLGFKINLFDEMFNDVEKFCLDFFPRKTFTDILVLTDQIAIWKIKLAGSAVGIANTEANNIIKMIYKK